MKEIYIVGVICNLIILIININDARKIITLKNKTVEFRQLFGFTGLKILVLLSCFLSWGTLILAVLLQSEKK